MKVGWEEIRGCSPLDSLHWTTCVHTPRIVGDAQPNRKGWRDYQSDQRQRVRIGAEG